MPYFIFLSIKTLFLYIYKGVKYNHIAHGTLMAYRGKYEKDYNKTNSHNRLIISA